MIAKFDNWNEQIAISIWQWWKQRHELVAQIAQLFPDRPIVEQSLVDKCPRELAPQLGEVVIAFTKTRKWFSLHAVAQLARHQPLVAFKKHLEFDRSSTFEDALREIVKRVDVKVVLDAALEIGESRLLRIAGGICAKEPSFLAALDMDSKEWRMIWYEAILMSKNPWKGINDPPNFMNTVLSRVLQRLPVENNLLEKLGQTEYGDLTEYPERTNIWQLMSATVATPFLEQTAEGWLRRLNSSVQLETPIEQWLRNMILEPTRLAHHFQTNQSNLLPFTLRLFYTFSELSEGQMLQFFLNSPNLLRSKVEQSDAYQLGQLIKQKNWSAAATKVFDLVYWNGFKSLLYALRECYELLNLKNKVLLSLAGTLSGYALSQDEWWRSFTDLAIELYQHGPEDNELWSRAGGNKAVLKTSKTGNESWQDATRKLRHGGGGDKISISQVLKEMREDFPNNHDLQQLSQLFEKNNRY